MLTVASGNSRRSSECIVAPYDPSFGEEISYVWLNHLSIELFANLDDDHVRDAARGIRFAEHQPSA